jgi:FkbM family methyltransferase
VIGERRRVLTDSIACLSRRVAQTKARKLSEMLFRYYPAKQGKTTIHDFDGDISMCLDRASYISSAIYWAGHHSGPAIKFLGTFLTPQMTLVDVGANIGEISLFAAKKLDSGRVLAFEPMPSVFAELSRNFAINDFSSVQVELFNFGLYHQNGRLPIYAKDDRPYGTTNEGVTSLYSGGNERRLMTIPLRRFDEVASERKLDRLDVMKIDVEGAEWMVLRGAEDSLKRFRPTIILEISGNNFEKAGYTSGELVGYLKALEYEIRDLSSGREELKAECDAVCFPRESSGTLQRSLKLSGFNS